MRHPQLIKRRKIMFYEAVTSSAENGRGSATSPPRASPSSADHAVLAMSCGAGACVHALFVYGRGCKGMSGRVSLSLVNLIGEFFDPAKGHLEPFY